MSTAQQSPAPATAKVKRYNCLFSDQVNKKHRTYKDGYLRHHHFNNRLYLLSPSQAELSTSFYRPLRPTPLPLPDSFELDEGEKIEFDGFVAEVGAVEFESTTNVSAIHARAKDPEQARKWAKELDEAESTASTSNITPRRPATGSAGVGRSATRPTSGVFAGLIPTSARSANASSTATPSRQVLVPPKPAYKGFGVPPPASYTPGSKPSKSRQRGATSPPPAFPKALPAGGRPTTSDPNYRPVAASTPRPAGGARRGYGATSGGPSGPSFSPYARPPPPPLGGPATPGSRPSAAGMGTPREEMSGVRELGGASTPSKGAVAAFKMPRPGAGLAGTPPGLRKG